MQSDIQILRTFPQAMFFLLFFSFVLYSCQDEASEDLNIQYGEKNCEGQPKPVGFLLFFERHFDQDTLVLRLDGQAMDSKVLTTPLHGSAGKVSVPRDGKPRSVQIEINGKVFSSFETEDEYPFIYIQKPADASHLEVLFSCKFSPYL